jgi:hypothetical protein
MTLLKLTLSEDNLALYVKPDAIISFSTYTYDSGSTTITTSSGDSYLVKEKPTTIIGLLDIASKGTLTVIDKEMKPKH